MDGVPARQAGLAGGLVNTTRQVGGAVGLAVLTTLAGSVTGGAATHGSHLEALTAGYRAAFAVSAAVLTGTAVLAVLLARCTGRRKATAAPGAVPAKAAV